MIMSTVEDKIYCQPSFHLVYKVKCRNRVMEPVEFIPQEWCFSSIIV